jgi:hypothetical protein
MSDQLHAAAALRQRKEEPVSIEQGAILLWRKGTSSDDRVFLGYGSAKT